MNNSVGCFKIIKQGLKSLWNRFFVPLRKDSYGKYGRYSDVKTNSTLVLNNIYVDDYVVIQDQTNFISLKGKLKVGKYSVISSGCTIVPGAHKLTVGVPFFLATTNHINDDEGDVVIGEDCWIGAGSILLPKCRIGRGAVVGAGSVVKKDVPPYAVVAGVPAKIIATKFTLDQILKHEAILYPPEERMQKKELEDLFTIYYQGIRSIGSDNLSQEESEALYIARKQKGIIDYSV